ncbi:MAG: MmcQ/YjbR family DNA-binding protein [Cytophagaceae bacterium]|jgi:predicted DNA-binding protein (MmcQ/YjbR family)|nr:MmcQ/YjbR family DNA-binding protein [Cytophagaceae bacterium]
MNIEDFRSYCLAKKGTSEDFPFDERILVFKVADKIFALTDVDDFVSINLKCDPEKALELRDRYHGIQPGYHMNKKHWNTVSLESDVPAKLIKELIDHSYEQVLLGLSKKVRDGLLK